MLPLNCNAVIDRSSWKVPPIFTFMEKMGHVEHDEMYRVFNMGIGFVLIVRQKDADETIEILRKARTTATVIGRIERGSKKVLYREPKPKASKRK